MTLLSVNLNKIALIRNSRGRGIPDLSAAARCVLTAGAGGITLHPREDARHATLEDVGAIALLREQIRPRFELNVEGDLRAELLETVIAARADQFTLVPVTPGEITSHRGWRSNDDQAALRDLALRLSPTTRLAVFIDADPAIVPIVADAGAHAIELFTGPYADAANLSDRQSELTALVATAAAARHAGLRINAGHDLTLDNLPALIAAIEPDEVSIGHQLVVDALYLGLDQTVRQYIKILADRKNLHI